jgi:nitrate/TMAO reductase-like tetraheme cytochrome c subunit
VFRNWMSLIGLLVMLGSLFAFLLLFVLDSLAHFSNPYVGVLTYLISPIFLFAGLLLVLLGAWVRHQRMVRTQGAASALQIDLSRPRDRKMLGVFLSGSVVFLLITSFETYNSYHFTESVSFCGKACHTVMQPELVSYEHGPHARVACTDCHIGPGATWYVRSKLSGTYQVYAVLRNKFPRPIPTPIENLRPAQETCEQCHWPNKFVGNLDRTFTAFLAEEKNPRHEIRMLMKVGGADPTHGPEGGIHWHMNVANKVEYLASDKARQKIPWVRMTDRQGVVTEFRAAGFTNAAPKTGLRTMDCMDCHNRPAHRFVSPNNAVNLAMRLDKIDASLPWVKTNAVGLLVRNYADQTEALQTIATMLAQQYPTAPRLRPTIDAVQQIYKDNFFPEMKVNWKVYPDNIGHKDWPGCFRCHDGKHKTPDGKRAINNECNSCHLILHQGSGQALEQISVNGQAFKHPADDVEGYLCNDCHTGGL